MNTYEKVQKMKNESDSIEPEMLEFVINVEYGGFSLTKEAYEYIGIEWDGMGKSGYAFSENRSNPKLVQCVKELGEKAGSSLFVAEIDITEIEGSFLLSYDGKEGVSSSSSNWLDTELISVL